MCLQNYIPTSLCVNMSHSALLYSDLGESPCVLTAITFVSEPFLHLLCANVPCLCEDLDRRWRRVRMIDILVIPRLHQPYRFFVQMRPWFDGLIGVMFLTGSDAVVVFEQFDAAFDAVHYLVEFVVVEMVD